MPAAAYSTRCHQAIVSHKLNNWPTKLSLQAYSSGKSSLALLLDVAWPMVFRGYVVVVEWLMVMPWFVALGIPTPRPTSAPALAF